jgi:two-component system cell cycle response regulator DivK
MSKKKILLVEDDADSSKMLKMIILAAGYEVLVAADAIMAKGLLAKQSFDLIILDISIPAGNGFALAELIRSQDHNYAAPIIFSTVSGDVTSKERAESFNPVAYFQKPYDFNQLLKVIDSILSPNMVNSMPEGHMGNRH